MAPEGLREQNQLLQEMLEQQKAYIEMQEKRIAEKDAAIADLRRLVDGLQPLKANLLETLAELRRQFFGAASEKTEGPKPPEGGGGDPPKTTVKAHSRGARKPKATRAEQYAALPVREIQIPLTQEGRRCPCCNGEMETVSYVEVREELRITPAKVGRIRYLQETAVCPECRKDGGGTSAKASAPTALMPHSPASASAVAYVMFQRVFLGLPYYRQEPLAAQLGLTPPRETMANWCIYCAEHYLLPLYEKLHSLLLKRDVLHADETTCQVLHEKGRAADSASYMWIFLAGSDGLAPIVLYDYQPSRRDACARDFLEGFHGLLQCDGNQGYNKVEDVALVCCLAHCRREFYEAVPAQRRKNIKLLDILSEETIPEPILP